MSLIEKLGELAVKLTPAAIELVIDLITKALEDEDPERYIKRRLAADSAHAAAQEAARRILEEGKTP